MTAIPATPVPGPTPNPPPPFPGQPIREPDPPRRPDEAPLPNPDENDAPPANLARIAGARRSGTSADLSC